MKFSKKSSKKIEERPLTAIGLTIGLILMYAEHGIGFAIILLAMYFSVANASVVPFLAGIALVYPFGRVVERFNYWVLKRFEKPGETRL